MIIINDNDSVKVRKIKEKFNSLNCKSSMRMLRGRDLAIWADNRGVYNDGYTQLVCKWKEFEEIIKKVKELGGKMYRGDSAAQSNYKIGDPAFPVDTMDAFISMEFYGKRIGEPTTRRSTYYAAIMAWAGIASNIKGKNGEGGYVKLLPIE